MSSKTNSAQASRPESVSSSDSSSDESDDTDNDGAFGDLFASTTTNDDQRHSLPDGGSTLVENGVKIRDFGQYKGISPRRVLEEACRAR